MLLSAGAGGQTGWLNPFAFTRAVRRFFSGPIVLAGGVSDGCALRAARTLGCDLAYMGTGFIATDESMADQRYKDMLVASSGDVLHARVHGLANNYVEAVDRRRRARSRLLARARAASTSAKTSTSEHAKAGPRAGATFGARAIRHRAS